MEGMVTVSKKEQKRAMVIGEVEKGEVGGREGAAVLGISVRHLRRIVAAYREEGVAGLANGNRGRKPARLATDVEGIE